MTILRIPEPALLKRVRHIGWPDHDVSSSDFYHALPQRKGGLTLQDGNDLCYARKEHRNYGTLQTSLSALNE